MKKVFLVVDAFLYWSTSIVKEGQLTIWVLLFRIIWRIFFWWKTILRELIILNCQVFCLRFSKAMTLNCSNFVYYSWKSLFLQKILYWKGWGIDQFFKTQIYGITSLSHHFEKEIYQYVNIKQLAKKNIFFKNTS